MLIDMLRMKHTEKKMPMICPLSRSMSITVEAKRHTQSRRVFFQRNGNHLKKATFRNSIHRMDTFAVDSQKNLHFLLWVPYGCIFRGENKYKKYIKYLNGLRYVTPQDSPVTRGKRFRVCDGTY